MPVTQAKPVTPSGDKRWRSVESRMRRLGNRPDAVIEALHSVQAAFGHIDVEAMQYVSDSLAVPPSTVFGVATFCPESGFMPPTRTSRGACATVKFDPLTTLEHCSQSADEAAERLLK